MVTFTVCDLKYDVRMWLNESAEQLTFWLRMQIDYFSNVCSMDLGGFLWSLHLLTGTHINRQNSLFLHIHCVYVEFISISVVFSISEVAYFCWCGVAIRVHQWPGFKNRLQLTLYPFKNNKSHFADKLHFYWH